MGEICNSIQRPTLNGDQKFHGCLNGRYIWDNDKCYESTFQDSDMGNSDQQQTHVNKLLLQPSILRPKSAKNPEYAVHQPQYQQ